MWIVAMYDVHRVGIANMRKKSNTFEPTPALPRNARHGLPQPSHSFRPILKLVHSSHSQSASTTSALSHNRLQISSASLALFRPLLPPLSKLCRPSKSPSSPPLPL